MKYTYHCIKLEKIDLPSPTTVYSVFKALANSKYKKIKWLVYIIKKNREIINDVAVYAKDFPKNLRINIWLVTWYVIQKSKAFLQVGNIQLAFEATDKFSLQ